MPELNEDRLAEIKLYLFLQRLDKEFNHHVSRIEMIQLLGDTFDFSGSVIIGLDRRRIEDLAWRTPMKSWIPNKVELVYTLKKLGHSVRQIYKEAHITQNTQYKIMKQIEEDPNIIPSLKPRNDDFTIGEIKRFLKIAERMKEVWK